MLQSQRPVLRHEQRLRMTPQLYQAIKIMAMPVQDLRTSIDEELEKNPALEVVEDRSMVSIDEAEQDRRQPEEADYFDDASDPGFIRERSGDGGEDAKRNFIEGVLTRPESLQEHLLWQLRLQPITAEEFRIGELLIRNLDDNGFHKEPPETLVSAQELPLLSRVMAVIRSLEPVGTCTAGYRESLLVQIAHHPDPVPGAAEAIEKHLDLLEREKYAELARRLKTTLEGVERIREFLKELDPMPGRNYTSENPRYVIPDVMVKMKEGQFVIYLNDSEIPVLRVNPLFSRLGESHDRPREKKVNAFVNNAVQDARWFIRAIRQRNATLLKVSRALLEFQREFFRRGPKYLVPLTLKDIAGEIGVHEATVSRATNGKYIQTEWGLFELKYFFSNSVPGSAPGGGRFSKEGVKQMVKEIIESEGRGKHLTDQKITDLLAERGVKISRRTVAKYRNELAIMSSHHR